MNKAIFIIISVYLTSFPLFLSAQETQTRNISEDEKRTLEKKFEKLKTFYIADDGTVVFQQKSDSIVDKPEENIVTPAKVKVKVSVDEFGDYVVTSEETSTEYLDDTWTTPTEADFSTPTKDVKKEEVAVTQGDSVIEDNVVNDEAPVAISSTEEHEENIIIDEEDNTPKKEVFKKKTSSYKSLEEAALAVDQLLEELKKQQTQQGKSKSKMSLSQKMSGGVDGSLRNKSYDLKDYDDEGDSNVSEDEEADDTGEPTYYINGEPATKQEVQKLKSGDVLKKVIKRSKTNPNGEWWIETKQK